jgi:O-antigen/teichoic acid export membrane protein
MSLIKKIAHNTAAQILGKIISIVFGVITISLMTRYLGQKGFGQYTTIMAFIQIFAILTDFGLTLTTTQLLSKPNVDENKIFNNIISLRITSSLVFLAMAPLFSLLFPYPPIIRIGITISALSFFFTSLFQIFIGFFQKHIITYLAAISEVANRIILLILVYLAVIFDLGLLNILIAIAASNALQVLLNYIFAYKKITIKWQLDLNTWYLIWKTTWPISVTIFFNLIYFKADTIILSLYKPAEHVGIYGAPYKILEVLTTIPFLFSGLILPLLTFNWNTKNFAKYKRIFQTAYDCLALIAVPLILGTQVLATPIMTLIAGKQFEASGNVLRILIIATGIIFLGNLFSHAIISIDKQKTVIKGYIITAILSLMGYFYFIPLYSYYAAAWMTVFAELFIMLNIIIIFYKTTKFFPSLKNTLLSILASLIMCAVILLYQYILKIDYSSTSILIFNIKTPHIHIIIQIILACLSYFIVSYLLNIIPKEYLLEILTKKNKTRSQNIKT